MATYYQCGKKIVEGTGVRKQVYTGQSRSVGFFGKRIWSGAKETYGMRLLCQDCARPDPFVLGYQLIMTIIKLILLGALIWSSEVAYSKLTSY